MRDGSGRRCDKIIRHGTREQRPAVPPQLRELAFKGSSVNCAVQIRHGPQSAWLLSEVCRQLVLCEVPAIILVENLSAAMTLVSLDSRFGSKTVFAALKCDFRITPVCGRLRVGKNFFHVAGWSVRPCVRPLDAVHMTAGHNAIREPGPGLPTRVAISRPVISSLPSAGLSCRLRKFKYRGQSLGPDLSFEPDPRFLECRFCFLRSPRCMAHKGHLAADNKSWQSLGSRRQEQAKNPLQRSCVWPSN